MTRQTPITDFSAAAAAPRSAVLSREGRALLTRMLSACALASLVLACFCFQPRYTHLHSAAVYLFLMSGGLLGGALGLARTLQPVDIPPASPVPALTPLRRVGWLLLGFGAVGLFIVAIVSAGHFVFLFPQGIDHHVQMALILGSTALVTWGASGVGLPGRIGLRAKNLSANSTDDASVVPTEANFRTDIKFPSGFSDDASVVPTDDDRTSDVGTTPASSAKLWERYLAPSLLLLITLLGLVLRLWNLGGAVPYMVDELNFALGVTTFWGSTNVELYRPLVMSFPAFFSWFQAASVDVFGNNLFALRLPSALIGTLTIPAVYLLARALWGQPSPPSPLSPVARHTSLLSRHKGRGGADVTTNIGALPPLLAALLLAVLPPHIQFSRLGINNIVDPLFGTLALAFLLRGLRGQRRVDYALAGAALGMTQLFYEGGRVIFPALAALTVGWSLLAQIGTRGGRGRARVMLHGSGVTLLIAALIAFPVYYTLIGRGLPLLTRMEDNRFDLTYWVALILSDADSLLVRLHLNHVLSPFLVWMNRPEQSLFYAGGLPLLLAYVAVPFLLGVWHTLWRPRSGALWLPLGWLLLTAVGNTLLKDSLQSPRYVVAFPAVAILTAAGIVYTARLLFAESGHKQAARWMLTALVLALAVGQIHYYFAPYLDVYNRQFRAAVPGPDGADAILRAVEFPPWAQLHLISEPPVDEAYHEGMAAYLTRLFVVDVVPVEQFGTDYLDRLSFANTDHAFFVAPDQPELMSLLMERYGIEPQYTPFDVPAAEAFVLFYVPSDWHEQVRR
jgi:4-amino-4-deoxy-L-arabinose transferase-like glycosyltransferase